VLNNEQLQSLIISAIPINQLAEAVGEYLFKRLQTEGMIPTKGTQKNRWLTHKEAAEYIRKSPDALYKLTSNKEIKYTKRGKPNMYRMEDLDNYMQAGFQETADEIVRDLKLLPKRKYSITKK